MRPKWLEEMSGEKYFSEAGIEEFGDCIAITDELPGVNGTKIYKGYWISVPQLRNK